MTSCGAALPVLILLCFALHSLARFDLLPNTGGGWWEAEGGDK